jgi:oxygen-independent coproporphyrinogen-3 oxidase
LLRELDGLTSEHHLAPETIYFGGGTPTALSLGELELLMAGIRQRLDLTQLREWSIEANAGSISAAKASLLRAGGITRVSLGVQSWNQRLLHLLGRDHDPARALRAFEILRATEFRSLSIDLMFGLPNEDLCEWQRDLEQTIALAPDHISTYCLTYEEETEFFLRQARGEFRVDEATEAAFFTTAMELLGRAGFEHYETSNYAQPGHRSRHNQAYWRGADYVGIGPSAVSTVGLARWQNVADYRAYTAQVLANQPPQREVEQLSAATKRSERIALSIRTREGVAADLVDTNAEARDEFERLGLWRRRGERFVLTPEGKLLADSIAEAFV